MPRVAAVIPNRNRAGLLERTLASVAAQTAPPARVVVVDNGSSDDSVAVARRAGAQVLEWPDNRGFAAAVNAGSRMCDEEWVLILNNDAELEPGCLEALLDAARRHQAAGAAPRLLRFAQPDRLDGAWDLLARGAVALRCGHNVPDSAAWREERLISFAPLTAALLRREFCALDEAFVSYMEDVELSLRLALAGERLVYAPAAVARHHGSATLGAWSAEFVRLMARNQLLLVARHYPRGWWLREGWAVFIGQALWGLGALRRGRLLPWLAGKWRGFREFHGHRRPSPCPECFRAVLRESERELRAHVRAQPSWYWRMYCALTRPG